MFGTIPTVRTYNSADETIADSTFTTLTFDTNRYDVNAVPTKPIGLTANVRWTANATGFRDLDFEKGPNFEGGSQITAASASVDAPQSVTTQLRLAAGDYLTVDVYQTSGGDLAVPSSADTPAFEMTWIAP